MEIRSANSIHKFDSLGALARKLETKRSERFHITRCGGLTMGEDQTKWCGDGIDRGLLFCKIGDIRMVSMAQRLLDKLKSQIDLEWPEWQSSIAGAYPMVPDYLVGLPENMRTRSTSLSDRAPIRIVYSTCSSCGFSGDVLIKRGVTVLALVMKLANIRPVEVYTLHTSHAKNEDQLYVLLTKLNTTPLDLASTCFALASATFSRAITYAYGTSFADFVGLTVYGSEHSPKKWNVDWLQNELGPHLGFTKSDLIIPAIRVDDDLLKSPITWVQSKIDLYSKGLHS